MMDLLNERKELIDSSLKERGGGCEKSLQNDELFEKLDAASRGHLSRKEFRTKLRYVLGLLTF